MDLPFNSFLLLFLSFPIKDDVVPLTDSLIFPSLQVAKRNDKFSANDMSGYKPSSFDKDFRSGKGGNYAPRAGTKGGRGGRGKR